MIFILNRALYAALVTIISVVVLFVLTRLMGQRQIAQLSLYDYITGITIGSIAAELAIAPPEDGVIAPIVAMVIYTGAEVLLAISTDKSLFMRNLISGHPLILYDKGKLYVKNLARAKLDVNEFLSLAREQGYFSITDLEYALLEPNGKVSFLPIAAKRPLTPEDMSITPEQERPVHQLILNGKVLEKNIKQLGYNRQWLDLRLHEQNAPAVDEIVLAICDDKGNVTIYRDDSK